MPTPRPILAFEPDDDLQESLETVVGSWGGGFQLRCWNRAEEFRADLPHFLSRAALIVIAEHPPL